MKARFIALAVVANMIAASGARALDQSLPAYQRAGDVSGPIGSVGSDSLNAEMEYWAKGFEDFYPGVKIEIEGKGSATAPSALVDGVAQFGPMSRPMTAEEVDAFERKYGYRPARFRVAVDALAIYVNKDNPISCFTLQDLDRIFSATRKGAGGKAVNSWGELGLTGEWAARPIALFGRNEISGTYEFFKRNVLYDGDYKKDVRERPGSTEVVQSVATDKFAIGYSGLGAKTEGVRTVPLAASPGRPCYDTTAEATYSGKYPIARYLYVYVNKKPNEPLDPLRAEFIKYILSKDGQR